MIRHCFGMECCQRNIFPSFILILEISFLHFTPGRHIYDIVVADIGGGTFMRSTILTFVQQMQNSGNHVLASMVNKLCLTLSSYDRGHYFGTFWTANFPPKSKSIGRIVTFWGQFYHHKLFHKFCNQQISKDAFWCQAAKVRMPAHINLDLYWSGKLESFTAGNLIWLPLWFRLKTVFKVCHTT